MPSNQVEKFLRFQNIGRQSCLEEGWSPPKAGEEDDASGEDAECERCGEGHYQVEPAIV